MPTELEISGSPSVEFAANLNFHDYLSDMTDNIVNADSHSKIVPCTNPSLEDKTFVVRMEIFRKENYRCELDEDLLSGDISGHIIINGIKIPVDLINTGGDKKFLVLNNDKTIAESETHYTIAFKGLEDYLEGFEFNGIQSRVYIYGTELVDVMKIDIHQVESDGTVINIIPGEDIEKGASGIEFLNEYTGPALPSGGAEIETADIINSGGDLSLKYKIYMPAGAVIDYEWIDDPHTIVAEIVIWLPMRFDSTKEDATFKFPDFFNGLSEAIKSLAKTGSIEDMNIKISIDPFNPFRNGEFIISDAGYGDITCPLDEHNFNFNFTKEELNYINNNPFNPRFYILYHDINSILEIPRGDIIITTILLEANLRYKMEL